MFRVQLAASPWSEERKKGMKGMIFLAERVE